MVTLVGDLVDGGSGGLCLDQPAFMLREHGGLKPFPPGGRGESAPQEGLGQAAHQGDRAADEWEVLSAHLAMLPGTWQGTQQVNFRPTCWESGENEQALFRPAGC